MCVWSVQYYTSVILAGEVKSVFDLIPAADRERLRRASEAASDPVYGRNIVFIKTLVCILGL